MIDAHTSLMETLTALCALPGISGREDAVRNHIRSHALAYADRIETDPMGNLMVFRNGKKSDRTLMLCAHMDEVGVIITGYTGDGYLKFDFVGGIDRRVVMGKRVYIGDQQIPGVIGVKAHHLCKGDSEKVVPAVSDLYIDIGADSEQKAKQFVELGDVGTFDPDIVVFGHGLMKAKAIDDRLGCAVLMRLMENKPACDTWFVFTVQEEVGTRGAGTAAYRIQPS